MQKPSELLAQLPTWSTTATLEELCRALGICVGALLAREGRERSLFVINTIWKDVCEGVTKKYGIDLNTFKGTGRGR